ncbi:NAD(P)H-dependent glycerol-3-phosphate dehydrogenase [Candidatus Regiella insecticola]|uniref:Glycerol-3-phosphate dehydrogenase [NAD(P)+] n=1 Tax=Candidatus Regiella insecticola TaxID=138073 RepID=A0A6L2ZR90_9ENTR|nr:NAD(P)H-dependent glycerol-3-phosphate dehydrogenase [Candidatus Regiella insecticola]GFN46698.1 glycerol-3-phosphate dehydrogenase [NAD(P)+] [Candidatus Regiella insecticola]
MNITDSVTIIGAGSYGTALAIMLARNNKVVLWGRDPKHIAALQNTRCNQANLPNIALPEKLLLQTDLAQALTASRNVLLVVPSQVFGSVLQKLKPHLRSDARIVWATKGLEAEKGRLLHQVAQDIVGKTVPLAVISGPTFAKELATGLPTAIMLASTDINFRQDLQQLFRSETLRVQLSTDIIGVQLAGAMKNVIAIAAGISDGVGAGANARAALISAGLNEMSCLGQALGADAVTFIGIAGLGDLVLTCTDDQSRNRRFGTLLGQGLNVQQAQEKIGQVVEGYYNTKEVWDLAQRYSVNAPIIEKIYQILYCDKKADIAASIFGELF